MSDAYHRHPDEQRWLAAPYTVTSRHKDEQGNRFATRDYGPSAPNQQSWHCTYADGTYAYSNPSGSKYHDYGHGNSVYVAPNGDVTHKVDWVEQPSSSYQKTSAEDKWTAQDEQALIDAEARDDQVHDIFKQKQERAEADRKPDGIGEHVWVGAFRVVDAADDDGSIASRVKNEER